MIHGPVQKFFLSELCAIKLRMVKRACSNFTLPLHRDLNIMETIVFVM
jgi:hypothetical protein